MPAILPFVSATSAQHVDLIVESVLLLPSAFLDSLFMGPAPLYASLSVRAKTRCKGGLAGELTF